MKINISTSMLKGEIMTDPEADIHDVMDAITGALVAEGYNPDSIINGYENAARKLKEAGQ